MSRAKKSQITDRKFAAAYWEVYYGVLGKDTGEIIKALYAPSTEESDWTRMDDALRERFGWLADTIRKKAGKLAGPEVAGTTADSTREPLHRRQRK